MAIMTYLSLVNRAIFESKVTSDPLTAATFSDPPRTFMYDHFKDWINTAYEELFQMRPDWFFRKERTSVVIRPRLYIGEATLPITVGTVLQGAVSSAEFTVMGSSTGEQDEGNLTDEITLSVDYETGTNPNSLIVGEDIITAADVKVGILLGLGHYDFTQLVSNLQEIDPMTVYVSNPEDTIYTSTAMNHLAFIKDPSQYPVLPSTGGRPLYIIETSQGNYQLYPQPEHPAVASFDYIRKIPLMDVYSDVPEALPERFHMYLVWRAVLEYADFDSNQTLFRRAKKHIDQYLYWLERDELVNLGFAESRFNS